VLLNVVTVGSVQVAVYVSQQEWFARERGALTRSVMQTLSVLERNYAPERLGDASQVRNLIQSRAVREIYADLVVTSGRWPYEGIVYLNPRGAVHRDPDAFDRAAILDGMERSREVDGMLPVAGGYCYALRQGDSVAGYLWFLEKHPAALPTALPFWSSAVAVAVATIVFGAVLLWVVRRTLGRPLQAIGAAAEGVAGGRYDVRLEALHGIPELETVVAAFNHMAEKVAGHTAELERAVREAVEQQKQKERALVVSSRLASIGTLAAGVAHEINNPIGGMQNAVNRLLQQPDLGDKQRTYLQLVQDGLQRVARTARRLLDFSPRSVQAQPFALAAAIESARALVEHRMHRHGVTFAVGIPADLPPLHGDQHEITQVVLNLLLNSLDAFEQARRAGRIDVRAYAEEGKVHLHVDDDGPGMDPQDLGRVFDPFFTKKDRPDASGLGLFIGYSIVRNHGGEFFVESAPGKGFRAHIVLPANP
jgi:signal transduction histidine kinase